MSPSPGGAWKATVWLPAGRYEYRFVVDGQWISDPAPGSPFRTPSGAPTRCWWSRERVGGVTGNGGARVAREGPPPAVCCPWQGASAGMPQAAPGRSGRGDRCEPVTCRRLATFAVCQCGEAPCGVASAGQCRYGGANRHTSECHENSSIAAGRGAALLGLADGACGRGRGHGGGAGGRAVDQSALGVHRRGFPPHLDLLRAAAAGRGAVRLYRQRRAGGPARLLPKPEFCHRAQCRQRQRPDRRGADSLAADDLLPVRGRAGVQLARGHSAGDDFGDPAAAGGKRRAGSAGPCPRRGA